MSRVISVRDIQEMIRNGQGVSIPDDALVTPPRATFWANWPPTAAPTAR